MKEERIGFRLPADVKREIDRAARKLEITTSQYLRLFIDGMLKVSDIASAEIIKRTKKAVEELEKVQKHLEAIERSTGALKRSSLGRTKKDMFLEFESPEEIVAAMDAMGVQTEEDAGSQGQE